MRTFLVGLLAFGLGLGTGAWLWRSEATVPPGLESRWEATIYLPAPVAGHEHLNDDAWEAALAEFCTEPFSGATLGPVVEGRWRGGTGRLERETVRPLIVSFPARDLEQFRTRAHALGQRLRQEAIYIRYERPLVELRRTGS